MTDRSRFITDPAELGELLHLPKQTVAETAEACCKLPFRIPRVLVSQIEPENQNDPILLQFWPRPEEQKKHPGFTADPLCERPETGPNSAPLPESLLQKYAGRVLVMSNGVCAANCRFCFRRHFSKTSAPRWEEIARHLESDPAIRELILSGGDPLGASDSEIEGQFHYIKGLSFVKRVRIHTRYPVLVPERITNRLLALFEELINAGKKPIIVFHLNHPAELTDETLAAFRKLRKLEIPLFSQTVLLRGINDRPKILADLFQKEFESGVLPYYLHQLDRVEGAAHFEVPENEGLALFAKLQKILPGYLVPRYVREIPGAPSKLPVQA